MVRGTGGGNVSSAPQPPDRTDGSREPARVTRTARSLSAPRLRASRTSRNSLHPISHASPSPTHP